MRGIAQGLAVILSAIAASAAHGEVVQLRVRAENLSPANSVSFAPLRLGFHDGTFDVFNIGETATAPIISIAEGGSGSDWFPAFAAQQPNGVSGSVSSGGPLLPGATATQDFIIDTDVNPFFTFGAMVVPSNDFFIGNDSPTQYRLFDDDGNLLLNSISQFGGDIWDAGSEVDIVENAAFIVGGVNANRVPDDGVVEFNFDRLSLFNGLTTAAGYTFDLQLTGDLEIYRISFEVIPTPGGVAALGFGGLMITRRRRRAH